MQNYICDGSDISVILGSGETAVKSGHGYKIGAQIGVVSSLARKGQTVFTSQASAEGDVAVVKLTGAYTLTKEAPLVIAKGARLYWDDDEKEITTTAAGNTFAGFAYEAAAEAATAVEVRLAGGDATGESALTQATTVAALGALSLDAANAAAPTEAEIEVATTALQAKIDAVIAALKAAGLMATS